MTMSGFVETILARTWIRSDRFWFFPILRSKIFKRIPYALDLWALERIQYFPRETIEHIAARRFAETLVGAQETPFWRMRLGKSGVDPKNFCIGDISKIPILTKQQLLDVSPKDYLREELLSRSYRSHTSGSTGRPLTVFLDEQFELRASAISARMFRAIAGGKLPPVVLMFGAFITGFTYMPHHSFYLRGYNSVPEQLRSLRSYLEKLSKGAIVFCLGSSALALARAIKEKGISLPRLGGVVSAGEALSVPEKKEIEDALGVPLWDTYGMSEMRRLAYQCEERRMHLCEESVYFEVVDESGRSLPPGKRGRIIVTGFENRVMPLIRYDTGDIGTINADKCPCGRTFRTLEFFGRQAWVIRTQGGHSISLLDLTLLFDDHQHIIRQFQIVRRNELKFVVKIVPGGGYAENMRRIEQLMDRLRLRIHPNAEVASQLVEFITEGPNGKTIRYVDEYSARE